VRALALLALLAAPASAAAQDPTTPGAAGAEATVRAYAEAFVTGEHAAAAELLDPKELAEFVDLMGDLDDSGAFRVKPGTSDAQAFAGLLEMMSGAEPLVGGALESLTTTVIGSVPEGDSLRHVVVRSRFEMMGAGLDGVEVTTARWTGDQWVITFDAKMRQLRAGLEAALAAGEAGGDG
jgi:hypothetical protein